MIQASISNDSLKTKESIVSPGSRLSSFSGMHPACLNDLTFEKTEMGDM